MSETSAVVENIAPEEKKTIADLALFGGRPYFKEKLYVGKPNIGDRARLQARFDDILDRRWLTNAGKYVIEFERKIEAYLGVKHCIAMCNGTVALEIAIRALGLSGEVILPSFTFVATANALQWQEITPVFCDIDPETYNIDPCQVEKMITPKTTGILGVHLFGRPCDVVALTAIARKKKLKLMFDSAHAFGCSSCGTMIGNFGDVEVFSFHATKMINAIEGGAVVTNDDELAQKMRLMKNFGFTDYDKTDYLGVNGKMNEFSAAMGLTNLEQIDNFSDVNRENYEQFKTLFQDIPGMTLLRYDHTDESTCPYIVFKIDPNVLGISRDLLVKILHAENIMARRYFYPGCHRMEPYRSYFPHTGMMLPVTERIAKRVFCLPTGTAITRREIAGMSDVVRFIVANRARINEVYHAAYLDKHGE